VVKSEDIEVKVVEEKMVEGLMEEVEVKVV
jgi:hypothetical protein